MRYNRGTHLQARAGAAVPSLYIQRRNGTGQGGRYRQTYVRREFVNRNREMGRQKQAKRHTTRDQKWTEDGEATTSESPWTLRLSPPSTAA